MAAPVIIGAGLAGLSVALSLAPLSVVVLGRKTSSSLTSSALAQGGIAAAVGDDDSPLLHARDTMDAGAGLCDPDIVDLIARLGPQVIELLSSWGVQFDRDDTGKLKTGLEGAHSCRRVVHAVGDSTGAMVMKALVAKARQTPSIALIDDVEVTEIVARQGHVSGVRFHRTGADYEEIMQASQVILATGSACALWQHTTVPQTSWGHGLYLAAQAGALLRDLEFVQFHPTALNTGLDPMPLISEALRGEGAKLVGEKGEHIVDELCPRDVVARALWKEIEKGHKVFLDARQVTNFSVRFPTIWEACQKAGIDPSVGLIPVRPVTHYHMGGVATDKDGYTTLRGLWACGEGACTGLHGANRLASNSLLEAVAMGVRVADDVRRKRSEDLSVTIHRVDDSMTRYSESDEAIAQTRQLMTDYVGILRSREGLEKAIASLTRLADRSRHAFVGLMIAKAALARTESRGAQARTDYPDRDPVQARPLFVALEGDEIKVGSESDFILENERKDAETLARHYA